MSSSVTRSIQLSFFVRTSNFFFNDTATTEIYTLSLHDALPISTTSPRTRSSWRRQRAGPRAIAPSFSERPLRLLLDDPERPAHERVDPAEVRVGAWSQVLGRLVDDRAHATVGDDAHQARHVLAVRPGRWLVDDRRDRHRAAGPATAVQRRADRRAVAELAGVEARAVGERVTDAARQVA